MKLLPKGKQNSGQLVPVYALNARAKRSERDGGSGSDSNSETEINPVDPIYIPKKMKKQVDVKRMGE